MKDFVSKQISIQLGEKIGSVSALLINPDPCKAMLVLGHGAGAGMSHRFMESLSSALAERGIGTLRYNFPYMELGQRRPDPPAIAEKTIAVVIEQARELFPDQVVLVGGKSFGGRMSSQRIAKDCPAYVKGLVFFGFPLHPAGQPGVSRADHLANIRVPMLFLQGTRDALAELQLVENVCSQLPTATLIKFEGADHSFKSGKKDLVPELAQATMEWLESL